MILSNVLYGLVLSNPGPIMSRDPNRINWYKGYMLNLQPLPDLLKKLGLQLIDLVFMILTLLGVMALIYDSFAEQIGNPSIWLSILAIVFGVGWHIAKMVDYRRDIAKPIFIYFWIQKNDADENELICSRQRPEDTGKQPWFALDVSQSGADHSYINPLFHLDHPEEHRYLVEHRQGTPHVIVREKTKDSCSSNRLCYEVDPKELLEIMAEHGGETFFAELSRVVTP